MVTEPHPTGVLPSHEGPSGDPPTAARARRPSTTWTALAVAAAAIVLTDYVSQVLTPFVRRDDWPYLFPPGAPGSADVWTKNLTEGRWLNYVWWLAVGQHETPVVASALYALGYAAFVVGFVRLFSLRSHVSAAVLTLAVFASPLWERLVYWPATLTASVLVAAAAVWTLPRASLTRRGLVAWVVLSTVLGVLTYPPLTAVVLVAALVHLRSRSWRTTLAVCAGFLLAYGLGILTIYALNRIAFGHFGIRIAAWRHPNPAHSLDDLVVNARRFVADLRSLAKALGRPTLVAGAVLGVAALVDPRSRGPWLRVLTGFTLVIGLGGAQTLVTGVATNTRGLLWGWLLAVVPAGLLLLGRGRSRWGATAALLALSFVGVLAWRADVADHQQTRREYAAIVEAVVEARQQTGTGVVVLYQDPAQRRTARGGITAGTIQNMLYERAGLVTRWCSGAQCTELATLATQSGGPGGAGAPRVRPVDGGIGVVVPPPARWL